MTQDAPAAPGNPSSAHLFAYIPGDRRRALATGVPLPDRVYGAALFADISGFTPLTEALANELGPHRGAEELTANLDRLFTVLGDELHARGGHIIYFSGDAITCWFDEDDGLRAAACGLAMQARMTDVGEVITPGGIRVRLAMKVAACVGEARRFVVGDPGIQRMDVLAGGLIDELAATERQASRGEVLLGPSAAASLAGRVEVTERRADDGSALVCAVVHRVLVAVEPVSLTGEDVQLPDAVMKEWVSPEIYERASTGSEEFLAELRPAFPLFVRFGGIDYDHDSDAIAKLDAFIRSVQRILSSYGGNLLHVTLGDKGAYLCAVFGAPRAHENDAARAAAAALEIRDLESATSVRDLQIGIAYGRLRSGTYGHPKRRAFTCLGDAVNLAARLMASAPPGRIYATDLVQRAAGEAFQWEPLAPLTLKGKAEPVVACSLVGSRRGGTRRATVGAMPMIGRAPQLASLGKRLDEAFTGEGRVVGISAEAGMGKSRLAAEFLRLAAERGATVAVGECQAYGTNTGYFVWRPIFTTLFGLDDAMPAAAQIDALHAQLAAIDPSLLGRMPLLGTVLGLSIPDNELTGSFDAKLRKTSLEGLLTEVLRARANAATIVLALEDCHWLDPLSRDLLEVLARACASLPVLLLLAYRPSADVGGGLGIEGLPHFREIALTELDSDAAAALIRAKLAPILQAGVEPPQALVDRIVERAQGNPFYIEELLNFIRSKGVDLTDDAAIRKLDLPESLHSLILSRIDSLSEAARRPLKVASVLGRVFGASILPSVYPELGDVADVSQHLATLASVDLVAVDQPEDSTWLFRHVVTQEVAYESMPFAFRALLHERVGHLIEDGGPEAVERKLDLLAHHYSHSANLEKKREFLSRAGDAAQAAYANASAIEYFERLLPLTEGGPRVDVLLRLGRVLELVGNWRRAEEVDTQALGIAATLGDARLIASCETALAEVARKQGRFDEAVERLDRAARGFAGVGEEAGVARVLHLAGTVAAQRGDYAKAVENYDASLAIRERAGDKASMASLLSNLGVVAEYRGDYDGARRFHERALELRSEIGDRSAIGVSMNNLGMIAVLQKRFDEARDCFQGSMLLNREVGDAWMVAICNNNLGNATRGLGDYAAARRHYAESLRAYQAYDDRWALAFLLEDIGILAALGGDAQSALVLVGAADAMREAIGAPRAPSLEDEIERQLAAAAAVLYEQDRLAHRNRGRSLDLAGAVSYARALCDGERH
ncbi:MAG: tetratricopeptide repeat protein [Burkholderiales bacterium]